MEMAIEETEALTDCCSIFPGRQSCREADDGDIGRKTATQEGSNEFEVYSEISPPLIDEMEFVAASEDDVHSKDRRFRDFVPFLRLQVLRVDTYHLPLCACRNFRSQVDALAPSLRQRLSAICESGQAYPT